MNKSKSLSRQFIIFSVLLVFVTSTLIGAFYFWGHGENIIEQKFNNSRKEVLYLAPTLKKEFEHMQRDAQYFVKNPDVVQMIVDYQKNKIHPSSSPAGKKLKQLFFFMLESQHSIENINVISQGDRKLLLPLNRDFIRKENERINEYAQVDLKSMPDWYVSKFKEKVKSEQEYELKPYYDINFDFSPFTHAKVYYSKIKLARNEKMEISGKKLPIIQLMIPSFDKDGALIGVILIDYQLKSVFEALKKELTNVNAELFITDHLGNYLFHPDPAKSFAFERGEDARIFQDYVTTAKFYSEKDELASVYPSLTPGEQIITLKKIYLDPTNQNIYVTIALKINYDQVMQDFKNVRRTSILISLILAILVAIVAYYSTKFITRNLDKLAIAANDYASGKDQVDVFINTNDEIGILAKTMAHMIHTINERTKHLKKSEERSRKAKELAEEMSKTKTILLRNLRSQKIATEKMAKEKDDLMAIVSHDLKNPLAVVENSMNHLLANPDDASTATGKDLFRRCKNSARFALNLITDLLDLARLEGGMKLVIAKSNINQLIKESIDGHVLKAQEKNITVSFKPKTHLEASVDRARLSQVVNNILSNALKFTPNKGTITITLEHHQDPLGNLMSISIQDTGRGIPKDKLETIFDKYQQAQTQDRETGTGLGLAICKNICKLHGGDVIVESVEGKGSTFKIILPFIGHVIQPSGEKSSPSIVEKAITPPENEQPADQAWVLKGKSILVIDDSPDAVALIKMKLKKYGCQIISAENGMEGLSAIENSKPDLVLLDLEMPVLNGIDTLKEVRKKYSRQELPIIIFSSKVDSEIVEFFKLDANDFANKKEKPQDVISKIEKILETKIVEHTKASILLVDDSDDIQALFKLYLRNSSYDLSLAGTVAQGQDAVLNLGPFDLIFLDMNLPDGQGVELAKFLRKWEADENLSTAPIIAITGMDGQENLDTLKNAGIQEVIGKSITKNSLLELIQKHMKKGNVA